MEKFSLFSYDATFDFPIFSPSTFNAEKKNGMGQKEEEKGEDGFSEFFPPE